MPRKSNYPTTRLNDLPQEAVESTLGHLMHLSTRARPKTDEEVERRIDEMFNYCADNSVRPGILLMCSALGVSRQAVSNWEHGIDCSPRRQELIVQAKNTINAFLEQLSLNNMIFPATSIFLLRNWAGMRYTVDVNLGQEDRQQPTMTQQEIQDVLNSRQSELNDDGIEALIDGLPDE